MLNILEYNICGDHVHILLVCDENKFPNIVGKIKAMTARACNIATGRTILGDESGSLPAAARTRGHVPLSSAVSSSSVSPDMTEESEEVEETRGHVPLSGDSILSSSIDISPDDANTSSKKKKKKYNSLWTQKFGKRKITGDNDLQNVIRYIRTNRQKHELSENTKLEKIIGEMNCSVDHAFRTEYTGGFDVVIGNPPYVFAREKISQEEKDFYAKNYDSVDYQVNTYLLFIEKSIDIIKRNGTYGLIVPNAWLMIYSGKGLRKYILDTCKLNQIINLEGYSFDGVNVETIIILAEKESVKQSEFGIYLSKEKEFAFSHKRNQSDFSKNEGLEFKVFSDEISLSLTKKIKSNSVILDSIVQIKAGLKAYEKGKGNPKQTMDDVKTRPYDYDHKFDDSTYKYLEGKDVSRYIVSWAGIYLKYGEHLAAPRTFNLFNGKKIIIREITGKYPKSIIATYNEDTYLFNMSNIAIVEKEDKDISLKYILSVLNSSLTSYYFIKNTAKSVRRMFPKVILKDLRLFPFKEIVIEQQQPFINKADKMLELNKQLQEKKTKFLNRVKDNLGAIAPTRGHVPLANVPLANVPIKISKKLKEFYNYDFRTFLAELKKQKVTLSLSRQDEWEEYFSAYKDEINQLQDEIHTTDKEIDQMVYELYGLTEEEIGIVEGNNV